MKYSVSLIDSEDKAKTLLSEVFIKGREIIDSLYNIGIDFPVDRHFHSNSESYRYTIKHSDQLMFTFALTKIDKFYHEIVRIIEHKEFETIIEDQENNKMAIHKAIDYLEEKYDLDFTPLNPDNPDKRINFVESNGNKLKASFILNDVDSIYSVEFTCDDGKNGHLKISEDITHTIFLD